MLRDNTQDYDTQHNSNIQYRTSAQHNTIYIHATALCDILYSALEILLLTYLLTYNDVWSWFNIWYHHQIYVVQCRAVLVGSLEWSMIVTSRHDLIAIMVATSVPLVIKITVFLSGHCCWASVSRLAHLVWETSKSVAASVCCSGRECNLIADVVWPVLIGLQLQEPTNKAFTREWHLCWSHLPCPPFPLALILLLQTTVVGERWHDIAWIPADTRPHDIAAVQFAGL